MKLPMILVNFKLYEQGSGSAAVELARVHEKVAQETGASIAVAVSFLDLTAVCEAVSIPVFAQHVDAVGYGAGTGSVSPFAVQTAGAYGTLLNHAERKVGDIVLRDSVKMAREAGLFTIVCAEDEDRAKKILDFEPDLIAVEPPELIGGDVSVSKSGPEIIERSVECCGRGNVLVGAGIKDPEDVQIALNLGASGVLVASGVVKADDPYMALMGLVSGLKGEV